MRPSPIFWVDRSKQIFGCLLKFNPTAPVDEVHLGRPADDGVWICGKFTKETGFLKEKSWMHFRSIINKGF